MAAFFLTLVLCVIFALSLASNATVSKSPDTVTSLDVPKYLGLWYQMYADEIVIKTTEKDTFCATAFYGDNKDNTLSVHNYATLKSPTGSVYIIDGYAYQTNAEQEPGKLKVVFESDDAAPVPAPYWILALGPVVNNYYDWAIVSDSFGSSLFVLARDPDTFKTKYDTEVVKMCTDLGFTGRSAPIAIYQGHDCNYESVIRRKQIASFAK